MEEKVFGLPAGLLANSMIVILLAISIILLFGGLRRFILVKMGTRNIPRRKGQSTLIVMGLMLSSIIVAVSLGIGDTVRYSVRSVVFDSAGNIDETIDGPGKQLFGVEYFDYSQFENVEKLASTNINIDGVMPYIEIDLPAENDISGIAESRVQVRGYNPKYTDRFDEIKNINDEFTTIDSLGNGQVFINSALSETLNLNKGDTIGIYINLEKKEFEVNDVLKSGSIAGANITPTISFNLSALQSLLGKENMITNIAISNSGDQDKALELSDDITPIFFTFSKSLIHPYTLPITVPASLLVTHYWSEIKFKKYYLSIPILSYLIILPIFYSGFVDKTIESNCDKGLVKNKLVSD